MGENNNERPTVSEVKRLDWQPGADQRLYRVSLPVSYTRYEDGRYVERHTDYVAISAVNDAYVYVCETFIFPADEDGEVLDWGEMSGSYRGGLSHAEAIERAGWELV